ncbi:MAG TPA: hypothetical protein VG796_19805 [Verrucomicrobiales bacterium]|nr:hypothetical protein [Verrucomicrobiales bacterium]
MDEATFLQSLKLRYDDEDMLKLFEGEIALRKKSLQPHEELDFGAITAAVRMKSAVQTPRPDYMAGYDS